MVTFFKRPWRSIWTISIALAAWYFYDGWAAALVVLATTDVTWRN